MNLEIHGAGFQNKGAQLMLSAALYELRTRIVDLDISIDPGYGSYFSRTNVGLNQIFPARFHVSKKGFSKRLGKQKLFCNSYIKNITNRILSSSLESYGCVTLSSIDGLIDVSGFAYTDQWGAYPSQNFAKLARFYKARNKPVILLPQAFGPFKTAGTRKAFEKIVQNSSLIFARDMTSLKHISEIAQEPNKIFVAPDITLFYPNQEIQLNLNISNYVCIVPNCRMLDQGSNSWKSIYELYLVEVINRILDQGKRIYIIIHDSSGEDMLIARRIIKKINQPDVRVCEESDPVKLKEILSKSFFIIGSRYHSLVSGFSKCVPSIALGWSHKYEMLYQEFDCSEYVLTSESNVRTLFELTDNLLDEAKNLILRRRIFEQLQKMKCQNNEMWVRVVNLILSQAS